MSTKFGAVVMLDALGTRSLTSSAANEFLASRKRFTQYLETKLNEMNTAAKSIDESIANPEVTMFGDTVLLSWELPQDQLESHLLNRFLILLRPTMFVGLQTGFIFRGALSVGEFIKEEATLIGPAISDVASWYEQANWMGIIVTPACEHRLSRIAEKRKSSINEWAVEYDVPLSRGGTRKLWTVSWPVYYLASGESIFKQLLNYPVPLNTEDKYSNTVQFFEWFKSNFGEAFDRKTKQDSE